MNRHVVTEGSVCRELTAFTVNVRQVTVETSVRNVSRVVVPYWICFPQLFLFYSYKNDVLLACVCYGLCLLGAVAVRGCGCQGIWLLGAVFDRGCVCQGMFLLGAVVVRACVCQGLWLLGAAFVRGCVCRGCDCQGLWLLGAVFVRGCECRDCMQDVSSNPARTFRAKISIDIKFTFYLKVFQS